MCLSLEPSDTCDLNKRQIRECILKLCEHGHWSEWSDWSDCAQKNVCDEGSQSRSRKCSIEHGCLGESSEIRNCSSASHTIDIHKYCNRKNLKISNYREWINLNLL
jgi:hypothetical protein